MYLLSLAGIAPHNDICLLFHAFLSSGKYHRQSFSLGHTDISGFLLIFVDGLILSNVKLC